MKQKCNPSISSAKIRDPMVVSDIMTRAAVSVTRADFITRILVSRRDLRKAGMV